MFIDEVTVTISGGHGGAGIVSFGKMAHSGPDGGNGGRGGDVYVKAENDLTLLSQFTRKNYYVAESGLPGGKNKRTGADGNDLNITLPIGTSIIDNLDGKVILELTKPGQQELLCKGGKGGKGNYEFRSPRRTTPEFAQPGLPGVHKVVVLNLKIIATFGFIGLPNAGKSSLLNELTNAKAKTANYSFTTLTPNLGVLNGKVIADIPGLIEGSSKGRGLGISFLKHIDKVKVLLHCIASDANDPQNDYNIVRSELGQYSKRLLKKKEIILLTKSDLTSEAVLKKLQTKFKKYSADTLQISIHNWESLATLKTLLVSQKNKKI